MTIEGHGHSVELVLNREALVVLLGNVEVIKAIFRLGLILERNLVGLLDTIGKPNARAGVGRYIQSRDTPLTSKFGCQLEDHILASAEATGLVGDVVRDEHNLSAIGILDGLELHQPCDHANIVGTGTALHMSQLEVTIEIVLHRPWPAAVLPLHDKLSGEHNHQRSRCGADVALNAALFGSVTPLLLHSGLE